MRNSVGNCPVRVRFILGLLPEMSTVASGRMRAEEWYMRGMPLDSGTSENLEDRMERQNGRRMRQIWLEELGEGDR